MGERGPLPKRTDQRRRTNAPADGIDVRTAEATVDYDPPAPKRTWHRIARAWYEACVSSGQAAFYEPSDYWTLYLLAEEIHRELSPRAIGITKDGKVITAHQPISGATLSSILKGCAVLGVTEGDRLRLRIQLETPPQGDGDGDGTVTWIDKSLRSSR